MRYKQQSSPPEWYDSDDLKIYASATYGTSTSNEWYEFDDRDDALKLFSKCFDSQSFTDSFEWVNGELYDFENILYSEDDGEHDIVFAESRF